MEREGMVAGMKVLVRLPSGRRDIPDEVHSAVVANPFTRGFMDGCSDVRLDGGEVRMVHCARIEPQEARQGA